MWNRIKQWMESIEGEAIHVLRGRIERQHRALAVVNWTVENKNAEIAKLRAELMAMKAERNDALTRGMIVEKYEFLTGREYNELPEVVRC